MMASQKQGLANANRSNGQKKIIWWQVLVQIRTNFHEALQQISDVDEFKRALKTYLFDSIYA